MKHRLLNALSCALLFSALASAVLPANAQTLAPTAAQGTPLPGVDRLFALQSDNTILAYATPEGYANLHSLIKHLDGDLDIIRTDAAYVEATPSALKMLGVDMSAPNAIGSKMGTLVKAMHDGKLLALDHLRLTTREDTPIDALLHAPENVTIPIVLVPREGSDGTLTTEVMQPAVSGTVAAADGTTMLRLPDKTNGTIRLIFLSAARLPEAKG